MITAIVAALVASAFFAVMAWIVLKGLREWP
jgi:hypothetical protein